MGKARLVAGLCAPPQIDPKSPFPCPLQPFSSALELQPKYQHYAASMLVSKDCWHQTALRILTYSLVVQAAIVMPGKLVRQQPVPFASKPTALGQAQGQAAAADLTVYTTVGLTVYTTKTTTTHRTSPTTAYLSGYSNLGCWSDSSSRILPVYGSAVGGNDPAYCFSM